MPTIPQRCQRCAGSGKIKFTLYAEWPSIVTEPRLFLSELTETSCGACRGQGIVRVEHEGGARTTNDVANVTEVDR